MGTVLLGGTLLAAWVAVRLRWPGDRYALAPVMVFLHHYVLPLAILAATGRSHLLAATTMGAAAGTAIVLGTRTLGYLRRSVAAGVAACHRDRQAQGETGAPFADLAVAVLLHRYGHGGMRRAEAVAVGGRCQSIDDLAAQVALREGGLMAYAAYLRRFGTTTEVADPSAAIHGDRFPGGSGR